jgi:hypothetical protein
MGSNTRIYDKFESWSTDDCACEACLYYPGKSKPCPRKVCCCAEEKTEALRREVAAENILATASVKGAIHSAVD